MVRVVVDDEGALQVDLRQRMPGRGAYLHLRRHCLREAIKRRAIQRALATAAIAVDEATLWERMRASTERRFIERLGLARRAQAVSIGTEAVREAMKRNTALFVCWAQDASESTQTLVQQNCGRKGIDCCGSTLSGSVLAKAMGLDFVSVVAIERQPFASDLSRLARTLGEEVEASPRWA
jgi:predicted RNA-binding protein YlxR (DUF448 family)